MQFCTKKNGIKIFLSVHLFPLHSSVSDHETLIADPWIVQSNGVRTHETNLNIKKKTI